MPNSELPDWLNGTPEEPAYALTMTNLDATAQPLQEIIVSRDEYVALKRFLAQKRGYVPSPDPRALTSEEYASLQVAHQILGTVVRSKA